MTAAERVIQTLPDEFTRHEALRQTLKCGYSLAVGSHVFEDGILYGILERTGRGRYRKTTGIKQAVNDLHSKGYSYRDIAKQLGISKSVIANYLQTDSRTDSRTDNQAAGTNF